MNRLISLGAIGWVLAGCASVPLEEKSAGHVIVPSARQISVIGYAEEWQPGEAQIATLEKKLGRLFAHPDGRLQGAYARNGSRTRQAPFPLSDYFIKYGGVRRDGRRFIVGKAAHRQGTSAERALKIPGRDSIELDVFGGGTLFFTVTFDAETNQVLEVSYNAPL